MANGGLPAILAIFGLVAGNAHAQEAGRPEQGRSVAAARCAACHAIDSGQTRSPRSDAASFQTIATAPGMTEIALRAILQTSHRSMPNLILDPAETRDIIAYILSLKKPE